MLLLLSKNAGGGNHHQTDTSEDNWNVQCRTARPVSPSSLLERSLLPYWTVTVCSQLAKTRAHTQHSSQFSSSTHWMVIITGGATVFFFSKKTKKAGWLPIDEGCHSACSDTHCRPPDGWLDGWLAEGGYCVRKVLMMMGVMVVVMVSSSPRLVGLQ